MINISRSFNDSAIFKHIQALSFKRKASTIGENKAINYIQNELADYNIINRAEPFEWRDHSTLRLLFLINSCFILIYELILYFLFEIVWLLIFFSILILILSLIILVISLKPNYLSFIGKKKISRNVFAEISAQNKRFKRPLIIFSAHYESTINKFPQQIYVVILLLNFILMLIYISIILFILFHSFLAFQIHEIYIVSIKLVTLVIGIMLVIVMILSYFNKRDDDSENIINRITGSAILIELAKYIRKEPLYHIDVFFLWTGADNIGLWGIRSYCKKYFFNLYEKYELNNSYNFNIDKIGDYIGIVEKIGLFKKKEINHNLNPIIEAYAKNLNIKITKVNLPKLIPHHYKIFKMYSKKARKEFQLTCFTLPKISKPELNNKDLINGILKKNLDNCVNLCYNIVKSLDKRIE